MSKTITIRGEECNICHEFMEFFHKMDCCQCNKYVCAKCDNICDGCGKYYTCKGKCSDQSKEDINKLIGNEYDSYRLKEYKNKVYCGGCFYDVECDIRDIKIYGR